MFMHAPVWRILVMVTIPVVAVMLLLKPGPVWPNLSDQDATTTTEASAPVAQRELEIVNPNLATIEFEFQPGDTLTELEFDDQFFEATGGDATGRPVDDFAPLLFDGFDESASLYDQYTAAGLDRPLTPRAREALRGPFEAANDTGWADGISRGVLPVPWLKWNTDDRSAFSIGISHQSYGEDTDVGVMGRWSIDF